MRTMKKTIKVTLFFHFNWCFIVFIVFVVSAYGRLSLVGFGSWPPSAADKKQSKKWYEWKPIKMNEQLSFVPFDCVFIVFVVFCCFGLGSTELGGPRAMATISCGLKQSKHREQWKTNRTERKSSLVHFDRFSLCSMFLLFRPWVDWAW